jgi:hypothetical protein
MTPTESTDRPAFDRPVRVSRHEPHMGDDWEYYRINGTLWRRRRKLDYSGENIPVQWLFPDPPGPSEQEFHNAKRLKIRGWWAGLAIIVTLGVVLACIIAVVWNALKLPYPMIGG